MKKDEAIWYKGGNATKAKYGLNHYSKLGKKGAKNRWAKKVKKTPVENSS